MNWRLRFFLWILHRSPEQLPLSDVQQFRDKTNQAWRLHRTWIDGRKVPVKETKDFYLSNRHGDRIRIRFYRSSNANGTTMFYLHGGGWVGRNLDTYDNFCRRTCKNTGITIYAIEYRKAPEVPFPGAIEDSIDIIRQLVDATNQQEFVLCGDSAGGNMAFSIIYLLQKEIRFQKLLAFYPPLGTDLSFPSFTKYGRGYIIETETIAWMRDQYLPSRDLYSDALASPLLHPSFEFLPEIMITIGGKDPLQDHVRLLRNKLQNEGHPYKYYEYPDLPHGFYLLYNLSPAVRQAYKDVYQFLDSPSPSGQTQ